MSSILTPHAPSVGTYNIFYILFLNSTWSIYITSYEKNCGLQPHSTLTSKSRSSIGYYNMGTDA